MGSGQEVGDMPEATVPQDRNEHVHGWRVTSVRIGARAGVGAATRKTWKSPPPLDVEGPLHR